MIFVITFLAFATVQAMKNVLLDSTTDPSSGWLLYSRTLQSPTIEGWKAVQDENNLTTVVPIVVFGVIVIRDQISL